MKTMGSTSGHDLHDMPGHSSQTPRMTLSKLRHDMRNHLNAIKLACALLRRQHADPLSVESIAEIDRSADSLTELVTRFMGDADAPSLLEDSDSHR